MLRPMALMIPAVTVEVSPSGLPIASAHSPTCTLSELPSAAAERSLASILMTARSVDGSVPISFAL